MIRFDYIPFKKGKMVDGGGYREGTDFDYDLKMAKKEAYMLCRLYGYDQVSIALKGSTLCVIHKSGEITERADFGYDGTYETGYHPGSLADSRD